MEDLLISKAKEIVSMLKSDGMTLFPCENENGNIYLLNKKPMNAFALMMLV